MLGINFLCNDIIEDPLVSVGFNMLSYILFETPESPLYKFILNNQLAPGYCPGYGYDMTTKISTFTIGVNNAANDIKSLLSIDT